MTDRASLKDFSGVLSAANETKNLELTQKEEINWLNETDVTLPLKLKLFCLDKVERTKHLTW